MQEKSCTTYLKPVVRLFSIEISVYAKEINIPGLATQTYV